MLCVDALDYDKIEEFGIPKLPYSCKLNIPKQLYHKGQPASLKIWPSIMAGRLIKTKIWGKRNHLKYWFRSLMFKCLKTIGWRSMIERGKGSKKFRQSKSWRIRPDNIGIECVFDHHHSFIWNIPTLTPECIMHIPSRETMLKFAIREYKVWEMIIIGLAQTSYQLTAAYCHILDTLGHLRMNDSHIYTDLESLINLIKQIAPDIAIMLISDHGMENGRHSHHAYLGCTEPISAESVLDVRREIERILES